MSLLLKKGIACLTILILCCSFNLNNTFVSYASEFDDEFMNSITDHDFMFGKTKVSKPIISY